jgi:hypothetical protein
MTIAHAAARCRAAHQRYETARREIAMLDALPKRDGYMRARQAERRDWERKAAFAVREMRDACRDCADAWAALDAKARRAVMIEVKNGSKTMRGKEAA